ALVRRLTPISKLAANHADPQNGRSASNSGTMALEAQHKSSRAAIYRRRFPPARPGKAVQQNRCSTVMGITTAACIGIATSACVACRVRRAAGHLIVHLRPDLRPAPARPADQRRRVRGPISGIPRTGYLLAQPPQPSAPDSNRDWLEMI